MDETSKCHSFRLQNGHFDRYLKGNGIDIGCGRDKLKSPYATVRGWDWKDGDAQYLKEIEDSSFDFVYSSHCLEHCRNIPITLQNWARVLKPGGFLYLVVPDYELYEKCQWPSKYNRDHKHSFSFNLTRAKVKRENHWTFEELVPLLPTIIDWGIQDDGYDYNVGPKDQTLGKALSQLYLICEKKL